MRVKKSAVCMLVLQTGAGKLLVVVLDLVYPDSFTLIRAELLFPALPFPPLCPSTATASLALQWPFCREMEML